MEELTGPLTQYGLLLVFANVLITQLGAPLPAIPTMVVAGALAQQGHWPVAALLAVTVVASLLGDLPWYYAGRRFGHRVINALCRISMEPESCVRQTEDIFEKWGAPSLTIAKFVPGFATVAPPVAGAFRLPLVQFVGYSAVGALLWSGAAVGVGMVFHTQIDEALRLITEMGGLGLAVIVAVFAFYMAAKWLERWYLVRLLRMVRITVEELGEQMRSATPPVILDVRSVAAQKLDPRRIPGALRVDTVKPVLHADIRPDQDVVVYCT